MPIESCIDPALNLPEQKINRAPDIDRFDDWQGHGTPAASLAVGTQFGVAKKAKMFSIKVWCNWIQNGVWGLRTTPEAMLIGANKMLERHREFGHTGKAVMLIPQGKFLTFSPSPSFFLSSFIFYFFSLLLPFVFSGL